MGLCRPKSHASRGVEQAKIKTMDTLIPRAERPISNISSVWVSSRPHAIGCVFTLKTFPTTSQYPQMTVLVYPTGSTSVVIPVGYIRGPTKNKHDEINRRKKHGEEKNPGVNSCTCILHSKYNKLSPSVLGPNATSPGFHRPGTHPHRPS